MLRRTGGFIPLPQPAVPSPRMVQAVRGFIPPALPSIPPRGYSLPACFGFPGGLIVRTVQGHTGQPRGWPTPVADVIAAPQTATNGYIFCVCRDSRFACRNTGKVGVIPMPAVIFKTGAIGHSATSPELRVRLIVAS